MGLLPNPLLLEMTLLPCHGVGPVAKLSLVEVIVKQVLLCFRAHLHAHDSWDTVSTHSIQRLASSTVSNPVWHICFTFVEHHAHVCINPHLILYMPSQLC